MILPASRPRPLNGSEAAGDFKEDSVNFDFGEALTRAWQIAWKNKALWWFGGIFGLIFSLIIPLGTLPAFFPEFLKKSDPSVISIWMAAFLAFCLLFMLAMFPISAITQTSITIGVLDAVQEKEKPSFGELIRRGVPFFWRVVGVLVLYTLVVMLTMLIIEGLIVLLSVVTFGIGMICAMPLILLMYPAMYLSVVWMEQAMIGIIADDMSMMDAIRQGWSLIRNNLLAIAIMALVVYFGIGMISSVVMMPMMFPMFVMPFGILGHEINWVIISISILFMVAMIPLVAVFFGWMLAFTKAVWVLTYLRLKNPTDKPQHVLQGATA
jgi:hypothetical protein